MEAKFPSTTWFVQIIGATLAAIFIMGILGWWLAISAKRDVEEGIDDEGFDSESESEEKNQYESYQALQHSARSLLHSPISPS